MHEDGLARFIKYGYTKYLIFSIENSKLKKPHVLNNVIKINEFPKYAKVPLN